MDTLAAEVDRVVFTPYPTQLKVCDMASSWPLFK